VSELKYVKALIPYKDILSLKTKKIIFAKCPLKGWFVDHWAVIIEREDDRYLTLQFLT